MRRLDAAAAVEGLTGNGCHAHISVWDAPGDQAKTNVFAGEGDGPTGEVGLSERGKHFLGGIMAHAQGMCAITNPTVNSYKRLAAPRTTSGATWSPGTVTYGGNNRTHLVRIPDEGRFEVRLADGAANPYLMPAALMAAGLDGVERALDPGKRLDIDMYAEGHKVRGAKTLPRNLLDALRVLEKDKTLKETLGAETVSAFIKLKIDEWNSYTADLSAWERRNTLDC